MIECNCDCGILIEPIDNRNRPKLYVHGHAGRLKRVTRVCLCGCGKSFTKIITSKQIYIENHQNALVGFKKGYTPWNKGKNWTPPNIQIFIEGCIRLDERLNAQIPGDR